MEETPIAEISRSEAMRRWLHGPLTPWYYGWNLVATALLFQAVSMGVLYYCYTIWVAPWTQEFGITRAQAMLPIMVCQLVGAPISAFAGRAMDAFPMKKLVAAGVAVFGIGMLLLSIARNPVQIAVIYALCLALPQSFAGPLAAQTLAAKWFVRNRGMAIGWGSLGTSLGGLIAPPLVTLALLSIGWRGAHVVVGLVALAVVLPVVLWVVRDPRPGEKAIEQAGSHHETMGTEPAEWTTPQILKAREFWLLVAGFLPLNVATGGVQMNWGPFMQDLTMIPQQTGFLISLMAGTMIVGKLVIGALADRTEHRYLYFGVIGLLVSSYAFMTVTTTYWALLCVAGVQGFAIGGNLPLTGAMIAQRFGAQSFGRALGVFFSFMILVAVAGPLAGHIRDVTGSYNPYLIGSMILLVVCAIPIARLPSNRQS